MEFPNAPKSGSTNRVYNWVLFVWNLESSNGQIILSNLNVKEIRNEYPNLLGHNALEKKDDQCFHPLSRSCNTQAYSISFLADYL
jgi:hypothetical protein